MIGIYIITNEINGKVYIGQTGKGKTTLIKRLKSHYNDLKNNKHWNNHLQRSWNQYTKKYGEESFTFDILEECLKEKLDEKEKYWIKYYESNNFRYGYNKDNGGSNGAPNIETRKKISESCRGRKLSDETKNKISKSLKGQKKGSMSKETKLKLSKSLKGKTSGENNAMYGRKGELSPIYGLKRSNETKEKLSNSLKGHSVTEETKQKIRDNIGDRTGPNNSFYGKKHSEETKQKISNKNKGRKLSEKHKQILIQINTGRVHTTESKQKIREAKYKLTDIQVIEILKELNLFNGSKKELSKFMKELGLKYNVSDKTINRIRLNESYTHINRELI